jgi:Uma2 family endonuclease
MAIATTENPTIADLLAELGDIPPHRILFRPTPGTATEQDVINLHERHKRLCELVDGVLVEKTMGFKESMLAGLIITYLVNFVRPRDLGIVTVPDGAVRLLPGLVRIPDVSFVSWDRLPDRQCPEEKIPSLAPDLAVEVLSESNTPKEMARKLREYFAVGVRLVWYVDPETRTVEVFTAVDRSTRLGADQTLEGGDVLPGFALPLAELFGGPGVVGNG